MKLIIANKNYSSWSLRAWLILETLEIPFEEEKLSFTDPEWKAQVRKVSPVGRVPVLVDNETVVWDSLSIAEYIADRFPDKNVWPQNPEARAWARSVCAEMHASFPHLRQNMPMNISARLPGLGLNVAVQDDIDRVIAIWTEVRERFSAEGPMLFGSFSAADAFYAPVVWRFVTHDVKLPKAAEAYSQAIRALPSMKKWVQAALAENEFVPEDEPYRRAPEG